MQSGSYREMGKRQKLSVVLVPFPYQGHTTPMLQLASILHSNEFSIIVAHTDINSPDPSNHPGFVFRQLPSNLPTTSDTSGPGNLPNVILGLNKNLKAPLEDLLVKLLSDKEEQYGRIVCLIRDSVLYFAESVAANLNLPSLVLRTYLAAAVQPYHYLLQLQSENRLPFPGIYIYISVCKNTPTRIYDYGFVFVQSQMQSPG